MINTELYIQNLLASNPLREPLLRDIIESLGLPVESHGLDAGCGIGLQAVLMSQVVGPDGHITGLDILPELLAYGEDVATSAGLTERITFRQGDVNHLPFDDNSFDWIWSMDCVGYPAGDLEPVLKELIRVTKSGGDVIILGWSSQQVLPGHPLLEARLNATCSSYLPFLQDRRPESNFMRAMDTFHKAGLKIVGVQTFVGDVCGPLTDEVRTALSSLFDMLWDIHRPEVSEVDRLEYQRLCKPGSPACILNMTDYYAFFTYTMFRGTVVKERR